MLLVIVFLFKREGYNITLPQLAQLILIFGCVGIHQVVKRVADTGLATYIAARTVELGIKSVIRLYVQFSKRMYVTEVNRIFRHAHWFGKPASMNIVAFKAAHLRLDLHALQEETWGRVPRRLAGVAVYSVKALRVKNRRLRAQLKTAKKDLYKERKRKFDEVTTAAGFGRNLAEGEDDAFWALADRAEIIQ